MRRRIAGYRRGRDEGEAQVSDPKHAYSQPSVVTVDHRALLHTVGHRLVRAVAGEDTPYANALFAIVRQRNREWQSEEWEVVLAELDASALTVSEFLEAEHARAKT